MSYKLCMRYVGSTDGLSGDNISTLLCYHIMTMNILTTHLRYFWFHSNFNFNIKTSFTLPWPVYTKNELVSTIINKWEATYN